MYYFQVKCIMKSGNQTIGSVIRVIGGAIRHSCQSRGPDLNHTYVMCVEQISQLNQTYEMWEPASTRPGMFEATQEVLDTTAKVCGMDSTFRVPERSYDNAEDSCPEKTLAEGEECLTGQGRMVTAPVKMVGMITLVMILARNLS